MNVSSRQTRAGGASLGAALNHGLRLTLAALIFAAVPGCSGCWSKDSLTKAREEALAKKKREEEEAKKEKPKPDFEAAEMRVLTSDRALAARVLVKPGHWTTTTQQMRANNFDIKADLRSATVNRAEQPVDIEHTAFGVAMTRPVALAKGQIRSAEVDFYIPRRVRPEEKNPWLKSSVVAQRSGRELGATMKPATPMPAYQFYLLGLASEPDRYGYLKSLFSVKPPSDPLSVEENILFYQVVLSSADRSVPVPERSLAWSSIAYIVWDDLNPSVWSLYQQEALVDWLHWGGQLIISGPGSLGRLKGSFLEDHLPADEVKAIELDAAALQELSDSFSPTEKQKDKVVKRPIELPPGAPIVGVELAPRPEATEVPGTGGLVVERRIGRGRIVVTAFSLNSLSGRPLVNWPGFDGFFNACLLRRPPRHYYLSPEDHMLRFEWKGLKQHTKDARLTTLLRYFARDIDDVTTSAREPVANDQDILRASGADLTMPGAMAMGPDMMAMGLGRYNVEAPQPRPPVHVGNPQEAWRFSGFAHSSQSGVAGWNDFSGAGNAARRSLKDAAGIDVPESDFVLKALGVYLLVLVPLNWLVFRLIGRVEWAWVSAPLIAIFGAAAVVRMAQLDIGFARSRTEIGVLEMQPGYARGHLTRYTALYTSLSSQYSLAFDDPSALALPFSTDPEFVRLMHQSSSVANIRRGESDAAVSLQNYTVASNSTGMVHSEQMLPLGGRLQLVGESLTSARVANSTNITLRDCGVLARTQDGRLQAAWLGDLDAGAVRPLHWTALQSEPQDKEKPWRFPEWDASPVTRHGAIGAREPGGDEVRLWRMMEVATAKLALNPGDVRLIGWTDQPMPGMSITPSASQETFRTMALAHLRYGELPAPAKDANTPFDFDEEARRGPLTDADFEEPPGSVREDFFQP